MRKVTLSSLDELLVEATEAQCVFINENDCPISQSSLIEALERRNPVILIEDNTPNLHYYAYGFKSLILYWQSNPFKNATTNQLFSQDARIFLLVKNDEKIIASPIMPIDETPSFDEVCVRNSKLTLKGVEDLMIKLKLPPDLMVDNYQNLSELYFKKINEEPVAAQAVAEPYVPVIGENIKCWHDLDLAARSIHLILLLLLVAIEYLTIRATFWPILNHAYSRMEADSFKAHMRFLNKDTVIDEPAGLSQPSELTALILKNLVPAISVIGLSFMTITNRKYREFYIHYSKSFVLAWTSTQIFLTLLPVFLFMGLCLHAGAEGRIIAENCFPDNDCVEKPQVNASFILGRNKSLSVLLVIALGILINLLCIVLFYRRNGCLVDNADSIAHRLKRHFRSDDQTADVEEAQQVEEDNISQASFFSTTSHRDDVSIDSFHSFDESEGLLQSGTRNSYGTA